MAPTLCASALAGARARPAAAVARRAARLPRRRAAAAPARAFTEEGKPPPPEGGQPPPQQPDALEEEERRRRAARAAAEAAAYKHPYRVPPEQRRTPAFTRRRERAVGRAACLGVAAMWLGEAATGLGPVGQASAEAGLPRGLLYAALLGLAAYGLFGGLAAGSATNAPANRRDVDRRYKGFSALEPDAARAIAGAAPGKRALRLELLLGRVACVGFAAAAAADWALDGGSLLAAAGLVRPGPLADAPAWLVAGAAAWAAVGLGALSLFGCRDDPDVY